MMATLSKMRDMIAGTTAWQTICGVETAEAAKAKIFYFGADPAPAPPAMILRTEAYRIRRIAAQTYRSAGIIEFVLDLPATDGNPDTMTLGTEYALAAAKIEGLIKAIIDASRQNGEIEIDDMTVNSIQLTGIEKEPPLFWTTSGFISWPAGGG
jgi:hypothetical protein